MTPEALTQSLRKTIDSYPQWAGQLHWIPYDLAKGQRQGRVAVTYGSPDDPGVELVLTRYPETLASLVPGHEDRMQASSLGPLAWDANSFPSDALNCPTQLALHETNEYAGRPAVSVQLTAFACGGLGIRVKLVHCLADATAMMHFVKDWAAVHRALIHGQPLPTLSPVFDPALVDQAAAGDVRSAAADPALLRVSRSLPMCRYDWWASAEGCPEPMLPSTRIPQELAGTDLGPPGDIIPWSDWDLYAPVSHYLVYFTPAEVQRIWEASNSTDDTSSTTPPARISRLDALLAFIWRLIVRARGLEHDRELVHIMVTIGLRSRLSPPLPDTFLGSPITLARVSLPAAEIASNSKSGLPATPAAAIRASMAQFTPSALSALLHDSAHDVNPQHIWRACLGRRHSIVTSWQGLDVYGVEFCGGAPPRYVDAVMPNMDGCIHVMEAGPPTSRTGDGSGGRWYAEPVCLSLHLAKDVMDTLLKDPELRRYRDTTR
ncbi:hypothetical protein OH76DRAFT_1413266 [Lentinus brumalis]|uniref:Transferase family protein n=1 Tax=Lentinus brumalis TaxID=2498619 RepID=A0A371CI37_9APHY|nr:hypothetical protein OH76DRAFT_1413266 [Polyporus brumalis]